MNQLAKMLGARDHADGAQLKERLDHAEDEIAGLKHSLSVADEAIHAEQADKDIAMGELAVEKAKVGNLLKFIAKMKAEQEAVVAAWIEAHPILSVVYAAKSPMSMPEIRQAATVTSPIRQAHVQHWVDLGVLVYHEPIAGATGLKSEGHYSKGTPMQLDIPELTEEDVTPEALRLAEAPTTTPAERNNAVDLDPEVAT
jgi:hypothetical protein